MARRIVRVGRSKSLKTWLGQGSPAFGTDLTGAPGAFSPGLKVFGTPDSFDVTILRTRGEISANSVNDSGGNVYQLALGIGLCTTEAALAGAVPLPFDNPEWDGWFVYQVMGLMPQDGAGAGPTYMNTMEVDSKAMRKIPSGQVLFLSTQLFTAAGTTSLSVSQSIQIRQLQKTS